MKKRSFTNILAELDEGKVLSRLDEELPKLAMAVMETAKKGSLTVTITFNRERNGMLSAQADCKVTIPKPATEATFFFATPDGQLSRDNPKQENLPVVTAPASEPAPLRAVPKGDAPVISIHQQSNVPQEVQ